jgi:hypothetical protein
MSTECIRVSIHSEALKFGQMPDPIKPDLKDLLTNKTVLAAAQKEGITSIGYNLGYAQDRALFAVQKLLDRTDFKGNVKPEKCRQPKVYHYYDLLPVLNIKLSEYLEVYGVRNQKTERHKLEFSPQARRVAVAALESLSDQRWLLSYDKSRGEDNRKMERVEAVAPLIRLERKTGDRNIRITPNPVLVDHIDSYFILKPESIFSMAGNRSVTRLRFLEFLLYYAEMKRREEVREKQASNYEVRLQSDAVAHRLRLESALSANQRARLRHTLSDLYEFGVHVGLLDSYLIEQKGTKGRIVDVLKLNKAKFEEFRGRSGLVPTVGKSTSSSRKV